MGTSDSVGSAASADSDNDDIDVATEDEAGIEVAADPEEVEDAPPLLDEVVDESDTYDGDTASAAPEVNSSSAVVQSDDVTASDSEAPVGDMPTSTSRDQDPEPASAEIADAPEPSSYASAVTAPPVEPAPAPLVRQPHSPVGVILGGPAALLDIAAKALHMLFNPGPSMPGDPPLLLGVLAFVRREIQRTFFNSSPTAVADSTSTSEGLPTRISVLDNDIDPNIGDVLTVADFTQAANGVVELNADGSFTYTPTAGFSGTDTFTYTISDEASGWHGHVAGLVRGHTSIATVSVTVLPAPINESPSAANDSVSTAEDTSAVIDVRANDSDPNGDDISIASVGAAQHGTVAVLDGRITYTPVTNFYGTDTFDYTITDGHLTDTASVTVTVTPVNDPPVAVNDAVMVVGNSGPTVINVLGNDTDPDAADSLTVTVLSTPTQGGAVSINADYTISYTPASGFSGTETFTYTVSDGTAAAVGMVTVTATAVMPVNTPPAATNDTFTMLAGTTSATVNVIANDIDADSDTLAVTSVIGVAHGTTTFTGGTITYIPTAGYAGTEVLTYTVTDGKATDTATLTIIVEAGLDTPIGRISTIEVSGVPRLQGIAVAPDGRIIVTGSKIDDNDPIVGVVEADGSIAVLAELPSMSIGVGVGPDGRVYVSNIDEGTVTAYDPNREVGPEVIARVQGAGGLAFDAAGNLYVTSSGIVGDDGTSLENLLTIVSAEGKIRTVALPGTSPDVDVAPDGRAFVSYFTLDTSAETLPAGGIFILNPDGTSETIDLPLGVTPAGVAVSPNGTIFVAAPTVGSGDPSRLIVRYPDEQTRAIEMSGTPFGLAFDTQGRLLITDYQSNTITVLDPLDDPHNEHAPTVRDDPESRFTNSNGAVIGAVIGADLDGDLLTYTLGTAPQSTFGEVEVDSASGSWVFTPSGSALVAAYSNGLPLVAEFTVTVSDGQSETPLTVSVPVPVAADVVADILRRVGSQPSGVAVGADGTVYVINSGANTLSVLSPDGSSLISTIHVGASPTAVKVGSDGRVWVTNGADDTVTVIDRTGADVEATIDVGSTPTGLAFGTGGWVYVTNAGGDTISVIDTATNTLDRTITVGGTPVGIAAGADGRIYVADFNGARVTVIDPARSDALTSIDTADAKPYGITVDADGTVYVTHPLDGTVRVLTPTATGYTGQTVSIGTAPTAIALGANGFIYVTDSDANTVIAIDLNTLATNTVATGDNPNSIAVGPNGNVYVINGNSDSLDIIDADDDSATTVPIGVDTNTVTVDAQGNLNVTNKYDGTQAVITAAPRATVTTGTLIVGTVTVMSPTTGAATTIPTGSNVLSVVVSPDSRYAYITQNDSVSIINPTAGTAARIPYPGFVVVSPDSRYAYITQNDSVSIINPATGTATRIPTGYNMGQLAVTPDSRYAYVSHGGLLSIINPATGTATTIHAGAYSNNAVVSPDSRTIYVYRSIDIHNAGVSVIDLATGTGTIIPTNDSRNSLSDFVVSPDGRHAYVSTYNFVTGTYGVIVINPATGTATTIPATGSGTGERRLVLSPDGRYAYVTSYHDGGTYGVVVINPATGTATTIPIIGGSTPTGTYRNLLVVSPDGRYAYVADHNNSVSIINPVTGTATTIPITGGKIGQVVVSPDSRYAYTTNDDGVSVIDPATGTATTIPITGGNALQLVVSPDSRYAYATDLQDGGTVSVINPATGTATTIPITGGNVLQLVVSPDSRYAYVTDFYRGGTVSVIDPTTGTATTLPTGDNSNQLVVSPDSRYAYLSDYNSGTVTIIDSTKLVFPSRGIAPDYTASTYENRAVTFDPTANPFGPDSGATITGVSNPSNGSAVVNGSMISYTPNNDYTGTDIFTYTATNGVSTSTGTIAVRVEKAYEPPVPNDPGPTGTYGLYRTLRENMNSKNLEHGIYTEHVLVNGRKSLIVYIAGSMEPLTGDQSWIKNLPSASGIVDQSQIDVIKAATADDPTEPILLVGFSQGGMDAQNIAARASLYGLQDQIKAVVTFGSPMVQFDSYPTVHLQDPADIVPRAIGTWLNWNNRYVHDSRNTYYIEQWLNLGVHANQTTYEDIGRFFDFDKSSHWDAQRSALAAFLNGEVVPVGYTVLNGRIVLKNTPTEF
ncbi:Virginiamycin B lyase [Mycolicibacterium parafortuitum]|uniref:Ig-like domain-containing protein n=1 Tax=Mycolicibacterium parafortuitum TaxID=39692 RepID=UPI0032C495B2